MSGIKVGLNLGNGIGVNLQAGPLQLNIGVGGVGPNANGPTPAETAGPNAPNGNGNSNSGPVGNQNHTGSVNSGSGPTGNGQGHAYGLGNNNGNGNAYGHLQTNGHGNGNGNAYGHGNSAGSGIGSSITNAIGNASGHINSGLGISGVGNAAGHISSGLGISAFGIENNTTPQIIQTASAINYLTGKSAGEDLLPGARQVLDQLSNTTGQSALQGFIERGGQPASDIIGHFTNQITQSLNRAGTSSFLKDQFPKNQLDELINTIHLERRLADLEKSCGPSAQKARNLTLSTLANDWARQTNGDCRSSMTATELLSDLRSCALLQSRDLNSPFPLTGIRFVSAELAALILTLEAIERALGFAIANRFVTSSMGIHPDALMTLMGWLGTERELALLLSGNWPALPGRMGRHQIMNFFAALGGMMNDSSGKPLLVKDGMPLKLGELMWFNLLGGLLDSARSMDRSHTKLAPLLVYGFDAIFSLIGTDGRGLSLPHFIAVQAQTNGAQPEWTFGQLPFSEGWMRAMIERLKDSASADENLLGEHLEDALIEGRFYLGILSGAVEEGKAVPESFNFNLASETSAGIRLPMPATVFC